MPVSQDFNPLATSHKVEHLSSTCLHNMSHDKPIMYLIYNCLNTKIHCLEPLIPINKTFFNTANKNN